MGDVTIRAAARLTWLTPADGEVTVARTPLVDGAIRNGLVVLVKDHGEPPVRPVEAAEPPAPASPPAPAPKKRSRARKPRPKAD